MPPAAARQRGAAGLVLERQVTFGGKHLGRISSGRHMGCSRQLVGQRGEGYWWVWKGKDRKT